VINTLRREILAARLKVILDEQLRRETSPTVKALARMKLPAIFRPSYRARDPKADVSGLATSSESGNKYWWWLPCGQCGALPGFKAVGSAPASSLHTKKSEPSCVRSRS
jgi:hypothetical protein